MWTPERHGNPVLRMDWQNWIWTLRKGDQNPSRNVLAGMGSFEKTNMQSLSRIFHTSCYSTVSMDIKNSCKCYQICWSYRIRSSLLIHADWSIWSCGKWWHLGRPILRATWPARVSTTQIKKGKEEIYLNNVVEARFHCTISWDAAARPILCNHHGEPCLDVL